MCGIVGYIGKKTNAIETIISGLEALEYRGYDSAGIAYLTENKVNIIKTSLNSFPTMPLCPSTLII